VNAPGGEPSGLVDPDAARAHWQDHERHDGVVEFPPEVLGRLRLPPEQRRYLQQAGLPRDAGPHLSFGGSPPEVLQDLIWYPDPAPRDPYRRYVVLGMTGMPTRSRWTSTGPARSCSSTTSIPTSRRC
jgi:hypothetical protein